MSIVILAFGIVLFLSIISVVSNSKPWQENVEKRFKGADGQEETPEPEPSGVNPLDKVFEESVEQVDLREEYKKQTKEHFDSNKKLSDPMRQALPSSRVKITKTRIGLDHRKNKNGEIVDVRVLGKDSGYTVVYEVRPAYWNKTITLRRGDFEFLMDDVK